MAAISLAVRTVYCHGSWVAAGFCCGNTRLSARFARPSYLGTAADTPADCTQVNEGEEG